MKGWLEITEAEKLRSARMAPKLKKMLKGSAEDRELAAEFKGRFPCPKTLKLLKFCTPYYEYVGIRTPTPVDYHSGWGTSFSAFGQPFGIKDRKDWNNPKIEKTGDHEGWPAIWRAVEYAGCMRSCGNSHQSQINDQLTTGLYKNVNGRWFKKLTS